LGKLGWSVYEYYTALPYEFYAAAEGYAEKLKDEQYIARFAAYRVACSIAGSKAIGDIERFWPIDSVEKSKPQMVSDELYRDIIKRHNLKKLKRGR
jgi:hypothetical protein